MTTKKIVEAFAACRAKLEPYWKAERGGPRGPHLVFVCEEGASYAETSREKSMRWLGFVQGALWALDRATIEELKNMNCPDEPKQVEVNWDRGML